MASVKLLALSTSKTSLMVEDVTASVLGVTAPAAEVAVKKSIGSLLKVFFNSFKQFFSLV